MRVPLITGLPSRTFSSDTMRVRHSMTTKDRPTGLTDPGRVRDPLSCWCSVRPYLARVPACAPRLCPRLVPFPPAIAKRVDLPMDTPSPVPALRTVAVTRYITPLREGGSLPALAEADDGFRYVLKFRGTGHGPKALISELIGGEVARALGLRVPELVFAELDEAFGRTEGDEEIQDLLKGSQGLNLGLHFLAGALTFDPAVTTVEPGLASRIVWLDAFLTNIDR